MGSPTTATVTQTRVMGADGGRQLVLGGPGPGADGVGCLRRTRTHRPPSGGGDIEDLVAGSGPLDLMRCRHRADLVVLPEPSSIVVLGTQSTRGRVVAPGCGAVPAARGKGDRDNPLTRIQSGRVPLDLGGLDPAGPEPLEGALLERWVRCPVTSHRRPLCLDRDPLPLGENGPLESANLLDRPARPIGDLASRQPLSDQRLHLTRPQPPVDLDLQLPQSRPVLARRRAKGVIEGQAEPCARGIGEQQVLTVLVDADQCEVVHVLLPGR